MKTQSRKQTVSQKASPGGAQTQLNIYYSDVLQRAQEAGRRHHYHFYQVGYGPLPKASYTTPDGWFMEIVDVPPRGHDRIQVLKDTGIGIKGFIVAHEPEDSDSKITIPSIPREKIQNGLENVGRGLMKAGVLLAKGLGLLVLAGMAAPLVLVDPILIVVLEDDTWLAVSSWYG